MNRCCQTYCIPTQCFRYLRNSVVIYIEKWSDSSNNLKIVHKHKWTELQHKIERWCCCCCLFFCTLRYLFALKSNNWMQWKCFTLEIKKRSDSRLWWLCQMIGFQVDKYETYLCSSSSSSAAIREAILKLCSLKIFMRACWFQSPQIDGFCNQLL